MVTERRGPSEFADPAASGGANTSHTILVPALTQLLSVVPNGASHGEYAAAVIHENVLGKATLGARKRTYRYLRELYLLRPESQLFHALRLLWAEDVRARPLLAGLCALARDPSFRASAPAILEARPGDEVKSTDLASAVAKAFPFAYNPSILAKVGRNTFSSWEQTGHLEAAHRTRKLRVDAECRPAAVAYALLLGMIEGLGGSRLFGTFWTRLLDRAPGTVMEQARTAAQLGYIDLRVMGGVVEVGGSRLLERSRL